MKINHLLRAATAALILTCVLAAAGGVAGAWSCSAFTPEGEERRFTLKIQEVEGGISATLESSRGTIPVIEPKREGSTVSFKMDYEGSRYFVELKFNGDKLEGTYSGDLAAGKVAGTRQP